MRKILTRTDEPLNFHDALETNYSTKWGHAQHRYKQSRDNFCFSCASCQKYFENCKKANCNTN
jgi:hypothetical protein